LPQPGQRSSRLRLSAGSRDLQLLSGEAWFDVAPDAQRPFRVQAGAATVRALGTQFNVYRKAGIIEVAVIEGKVEVSRAGTTAPASPTLLSAGEKAEVRPGGGGGGGVHKHSDGDVIIRGP